MSNLGHVTETRCHNSECVSNVAEGRGKMCDLDTLTSTLTPDRLAAEEKLVYIR